MAAGETPQHLALQKEDNIPYETKMLHPKNKQRSKYKGNRTAVNMNL